MTFEPAIFADESNSGFFPVSLYLSRSNAGLRLEISSGSSRGVATIGLEDLMGVGAKLEAVLKRGGYVTWKPNWFGWFTIKVSPKGEMVVCKFMAYSYLSFRMFGFSIEKEKLQKLSIVLTQQAGNT